MAPPGVSGKTIAQMKAEIRHGGARPEAPPSFTMPPPVERDSFIAKFTVPPYFMQPVWMAGRVGRWIANPLPTPPPMAKWFLAELEKRGMALSGDDKKALVEISLQNTALETQICENGFQGASVIFNKQREEVRGELEAGEQIPANRAQSREQLYQQSLIVRQECRELQKRLARKTFEIRLRDVCNGKRGVNWIS